jgi:tRNA modification GTPase
VPPTYAACLTPPGTGAIATLALRGPRAWNIVRELFRPVSPALRDQLARSASEDGAGPSLALRAREEGAVWLGKFGDQAADEVVLVVKRTAPVVWVELHCHGGREVVRLLLETLERRGVQITSWQELERLSGDNPLRTEARIALAHAPTVRTAAILLDQFHGALERAVSAIVSALERKDEIEAARLLDELTRQAALGRHLTAPWRVVVAGAPNVGKSSLVNALAGYQRSIVAALPGTTRDLVTTRIALDGWPVELTDTAGLSEVGDKLEAEGMARTRSAVGRADCCLWVVDASTPPVWPDASLAPLPSAKVRVVINKIDLPAAWPLEQAPASLRVSARTGAGLPELCQALARWLVPEPPAPGVGMPFTPALGAQVAAARQELAAGRSREARAVLLALLEGTGVCQ